MLSRPVRIAVVDDHHMFRAGVIELLQSVAHFDVVTHGASGPDAVTIAQEDKPDVLILDVEMPGPGARSTIRRVLEANATTQIVVLTMHDDADLVRSLFEAGAVGYLLKSAGRAELIAAIETAARNDDAVLLAVSSTTIIKLGRSGQVTDDVLSIREGEVLSLLAQGKSNLEIATLLFISYGTVKRHLTNIYAKLAATSRLDAVHKATQRGILRARDCPDIG